jgi:Rps23 Pro-64 3,4-dihydroxylase Tpa1-like proline 4-hydroxylase
MYKDQEWKKDMGGRGRIYHDDLEPAICAGQPI